MPKFKLRVSVREKRRLKKIYKSEQGRPSERAHIILLYLQGFTIREIAQICLCNRDTVSSTLNRFQENRFDGLYDESRSGCPKILESEDEEYLFSCLRKPPSEFGYFATVWTISMMIHLLLTQRKKRISETSLKRLLHQRNWSFKRAKHIPPPSPPIKESEKKEILRLLNHPEEDEVLLFQDDADLELLPYLGGAWAPKGEPVKIPTPGSNQILVLFGFFNPHTKGFHYKMVESRSEKTAVNFISALHQIRHLLEGKKFHIVLDNASIHNEKTKRLIKFMETYQGQVFFHFLPKHAPILNPIERFWKFLKSRVACNWLYESLDALATAFRKFVLRYRRKMIKYGFNLHRLSSLWAKYPTLESASV